MKSKIFKILGVILFLAGLGGLIYASVMQCILQVRLYGVVFGGNINIFVPDKSAFAFLGIIPLVLGVFSYQYSNWCEEKEQRYKHY